MEMHSGAGIQFIIFIAGGIASAIIDIGIMQLMIYMNFNLIISTTSGFFFGFLFNYAFHAKLTFKSVGTMTTAIRFVTVIAINYFITVLFVSVSDVIIGSPLAGKITSLPIVAVNGFILSKYWVFKKTEIKEVRKSTL